MRVNLRALLSAIAAFTLLASALTTLAQNAAGSIRGTVTDQQGAVILNADVVVTNKANGEVRKTTTGNDGLYVVENLPPGEYEVRITAKGFATQILNARVQVQVTISGDTTLRAGTTDEIVEITADAPVIDRQNYKIDGVITRERIENLPLNGRSFLSLAMLEPGVSVEFTADPGASPQNFFRVSIAGAASQLTRISVDGATANDRITGGTSQNYSQETVEEFQITSFNFDLSTGNTSAGAVNIVSRTGGNEFHGSGFFFFRDHNMAGFPGLRRPCDGLAGSHPQCGDPNVRSRLEDPFFARRQSGFAVGGPIQKDKLFWFSNLEYTNQVGARTITHTDPIFHGLNHIGSPRFIGKLFNVRMDYKATAKHSGFLRASLDINRNLSATGNLESTWSSTRNHSDQFLGGVTSVFRQNLVNDLRFSYSFQSSRLRAPDETECTNPFFCFNLGGTRITVPGGITVGNDTNTPQNRVLRTYQLTDNLNWLKGSHRTRFGGNWEHFYGQGSWGLLSTGLMSLYSPEQVRLQNPALYALLPATLRGTTAGTPSFADILKLPVSSAVAIGVGDGGQPPAYNRDTAARIDSYRLYFQDAWQIRPNFTLNWGLAWSFEDNIVSHDLDKPAYLKPVLGDLRPTRQDYNNFQPAIGLAWSLGKQKETVIRAGAGVYHDSTNLIYSRLRERGFIGPAGNGLIVVNTGLVPNPFAGQPGHAPTLFFPVPTLMNGQTMLGLLPGVKAALTAQWGTGQDISIRGVDVVKQADSLGVGSIYDYNSTTGYTVHTTAGVQHQLTPNMGISVDFVHRRAIHFGGYSAVYGVDNNRWDRFTVTGVDPITNVTTSVRNPVIPVCTGTQASIPKFSCSTGPIHVFRSALNARYVGLFTKFDRRFSRGFQFTASYALSRYYSWNGIIDNDDLDASYGIADSDVPHRFTFSGIWDLPDYNGSSRFVRAIVNDWQLSTIWQMVSAPPRTVSVGSFDLEGDGTSTFNLPGIKINGFGRGASKADIFKAVAAYNASVVAGAKPLPANATPAQRAACTLDLNRDGINDSCAPRSARNQVLPLIALPSDFSNGDTFLTHDLRLTRVFPIGEKVRLSVIAEGFNIFNIANLTGFSGTLNALVPAAPAGQPKPVQTLSFGQASNRFNQVFGSGGPRAFQLAARVSF
jgi:hypothetical protein